MRTTRPSSRRDRLERRRRDVSGLRLARSAAGPLPRLSAAGQPDARRSASGRPSNLRIPRSCSTAAAASSCSSGLIVDPQILFPPDTRTPAARRKILRDNFAELYQEVSGVVPAAAAPIWSSTSAPTTARCSATSRTAATGSAASSRARLATSPISRHPDVDRVLRAGDCREGQQRRRSRRRSSRPPTSSRTWRTSTTSSTASFISWMTTASSSRSRTT